MARRAAAFCSDARLRGGMMAICRCLRFSSAAKAERGACLPRAGLRCICCSAERSVLLFPLIGARRWRYAGIVGI